MLVLAVLAFKQSKSESAAPASDPAGAEPEQIARAVRFLVIVGLGPLLITALIALTHGTEDMWGAPMLNLVGLLAMLPLRRRLAVANLRRLGAAALVLTIAVPLIYGGSYLVRFELGAGHPPRPLWPQAAITRRMQEIWRNATQAPLRIVGGSPWLAGLVALTAEDRPTIYANFDRVASPWITDERLAREGALVVWEERDGLPPAGKALAAGQRMGEEDFVWSPASRSEPLRLRYAIVPPR
jgi:hypothetical protein